MFHYHRKRPTHNFYILLIQFMIKIQRDWKVKAVKQFFTFGINLKVQAMSMHITNTVLPRCRYGVLIVKMSWYILCNVCKHTLHFKYKFHLQKLFCIKKEKACNAIKHSAAAVYIFQSHTFLSYVPFLKHFLNQNTIPVFSTMTML